MTLQSESELVVSSIPIFTTIASYRAWRKEAFLKGSSVGFVGTMGALHNGHLSLVKRSLSENDLTVVSIFVNPAQFGVHEDLEKYPRTLAQDARLLEDVEVTVPCKELGSVKRITSVIFAPTVSEMYPSGIVQNVAEQKGTFVEVKGYGHQMEGKSRPLFFRGVATVTTKLLNAVQPDNFYLGEKDIQQALLLVRLCRDLLFAYPEYQNVHIVPTERDPLDGLALSSRNVYLTSDGRRVASALRQALLAAKAAWSEGLAKWECIERATQIIEGRKLQAISEGLQVTIKLDYIQMNNAESFEELKSDARRSEDDKDLIILSGALFVDSTRLIDNVLLGNVRKSLGSS